MRIGDHRVNQIQPQGGCSIKVKTKSSPRTCDASKRSLLVPCLNRFHLFFEEIIVQRKARFWTLILMVISATVVLSSPKEKSESALADQAEPDAITNSIGMKLVRIP